MICFACGKVGHKSVACPDPILNLPPTPSPDPSEIAPSPNLHVTSSSTTKLPYHPNFSLPHLILVSLWPWMVVHRKRTPLKFSSKALFSPEQKSPVLNSSQNKKFTKNIHRPTNRSIAYPNVPTKSLANLFLVL